MHDYGFQVRVEAPAHPAGHAQPPPTQLPRPEQLEQGLKLDRQPVREQGVPNDTQVTDTVSVALIEYDASQGVLEDLHRWIAFWISVFL